MTIESDIKRDIASNPAFSHTASNPAQREALAKYLMNEHADAKGMPRDPKNKLTPDDLGVMKEFDHAQNSALHALSKKYGEHAPKLAGEEQHVKNDPAFKDANPAQAKAAADYIEHKATATDEAQIRTTFSSDQMTALDKLERAQVLSGKGSDAARLTNGTVVAFKTGDTEHLNVQPARVTPHHAHHHQQNVVAPAVIAPPVPRAPAIPTV